MQVYFARSIRGAHSDGEAQYFRAILEAIRQGGHVPALEVPAAIEPEAGIEANRAIYTRDIGWIDGSQAMIAEVSNPSLGVGYEIAYARHVRHIPILAVARQGAHVSAMIQGSLDVQYYRDAAELTAMVAAFLKRSGL